MASVITANLCNFIQKNAQTTPHKRAVVIPNKHDKYGHRAYTSLTFKQLYDEINAFARGFDKIGIKRGTKVVLMITPSLEFYISFFALCKVGATLVMIDPGIGMHSLKTCIGEAKPEAFVGITKAHAARVLFRWSPNSIKTNVTLGPKLFWGGHSFYKVRDNDSSEFPTAEMPIDLMCALMFTSGSTGVSKGVVYTHGVLTKQVEYIKELYNLGKNDVDLATFPLFGLFDVCLGMTAVIPDMDATKPGKANPKYLIEAIEDNGITSIFGSPALVDGLSRYGEANNIKLPSIKNVISCGAPARNDILARLSAMLNEGVKIHTPYGATEALPVSSIDSISILEETAADTDAGKGTCVGYPDRHVQVKIIKITDEPIEELTEDLFMETDAIGEIIVAGPVVTKEYYARPNNNKLAKIKQGNEVWHRMGDVGRFDEKGRLWFCGRKSHRVEAEEETFFTIPCERIFNQHPKVFRTALVGVGEKGKKAPVICIELEKNISNINTEVLFKEMRELGSKFEHTKNIKHFLVHQGFPVDIRHNAKIGREHLSEWATENLRGRI
jgi:acyl-CoA synthetase (AMP-forming)/AMP-acid ligase II